MVNLRTLGESLIEVRGARIGPSAPHTFGALLYVGLEAGRRVPRTRLQELLFPASRERAAAHSLRQLLYRLRRLGASVDCDQATVFIAPDRVTADFERFLTPAERPAADLARLSGGFLPGFSATFSRPYADWLDQRRAELLAAIRRTLTAELLEQRSAGRWAAAEQTARALLALDPLNEEATLALAEATALGGAKVEAVQLLDGYLAEVGPSARELRVPAAVLRKRIAERLPEVPWTGVARFVGRSEPLALLRQLLDRARAGDGAACHVWGEAGIGKTRLVAEFTRSAILGGARVEQVSSQPHDVRRPMGAFSDLVPALLKVPGALGCSPQAIALLKKLFEVDGDRTRGLSPDVREAELLSANISRAISELLDAVTAESTHLIVVEDVQWLDPISLRVFADLIAERKSRRLVLVFTSREPRAKVLASFPDRLRSVRLAPLSALESSALLSDLFARGGVETDDALTDWCLRTAAGNPFFLHSLAVHYLTTRDRERIPEPLGALLGERLALLDDRALHVFEAASVLGRHSTFDNLTAVLGLSGYELMVALRSLEEMGFVVSTGATVSTAHALLSEFALARTPLSVRRLLHRNVARLLHRMTESGTAPAAVLWDCAEHWLQADDQGEAIAVLRACARHALEIGHPRDAVRALRRAVELPLTSSERLPVLEELLTAAHIGADWSTTVETLEAIRAQRVAEGKPAELEPELELRGIEATLCSSRNPYDVIGRLRRWIRDESFSVQMRTRACALLASVAEGLLLPELGSEAYAAFTALPADDSSALDRSVFELIYHASFGDVDDAVAPARRLLALAEAHPTISVRCRLTFLAGAALLRAGRIEEGLETLEGLYRLASAARLPTGQQRAANYIACILRELGRAEEARMWLDRAVYAFEQLDGRETVVDFYSNCALFATEAGDYAAAGEWIRRARREAMRARVGAADLHFRALELRLRQLTESYDCTEAELADLMENHLRYRSLHQHDEILEPLWHALARKGRIEEGNTLVREYFARHRRNKLPVAPGLRQVVDRMDVAEAACAS